jgi:large subunit ribosomal protein L28
MAKCEKCGKGPMFGNNRSHSMKATKRKFKPNLQRVTLMEGGRKVRKMYCTKCIKSLAKL